MAEDKLKDEYLNTITYYGDLRQNLFNEWHRYFVNNELDKCGEITKQIELLQKEEFQILDELELKLNKK